jgi:hypothetical protein
MGCGFAQRDHPHLSRKSAAKMGHPVRHDPFGECWGVMDFCIIVGWTRRGSSGFGLESSSVR